MRILIGIACLVLVFGISTYWHRSEMDRFRSDAGFAGEQVVQAAELRRHPPGWGEVIVGAPSGSDPIVVERAEPVARSRVLKPPGYSSRERANDERRTPRGDSPAILVPEREAGDGPADWELVVKDGDVLSRIVRVHYGRVSPELEQALAEYNGLSSPDKLRVGQTIYLPTEDRLVEAPE